MNLIKKSTLALAAFVAVGAMNAQSTPARPAGVLGVRYAEASFGVQDINDFPDNAYAVGLAVNLPVRPYLDAGFSYGHAWLDSSIDFRSDVLAASATFHETFASVKPFASLALGYEWDRASGLGHDDAGLWGIAIGVEIPVQSVTVTPRISYVDGFESGRDYQVSYGVEANHWFTPTLAGYGDVSYADPKGNGGESWNYTIGLRLKF